jgi:hypothetical protein
MPPIPDTASATLESGQAVRHAPTARAGRLTQVLGALFLLLLVGFGAVQVARERRFVFSDSDIIVYSLAARMWSNGAIPYRDFVDHKPPLIYAYLRLCYWASDSPRSVFKGTDALVAVSAIVLFLGLWIAGRRPLAIGASLAYVMFDAADPLGIRHQNTEHLAMTGVTLAFALAIVQTTRRGLVWPLLSGAALALGVLGKQPVVLFAAPLAVLLVDAGPEPLRARLRRTLVAGLAFALGGLLVVAAVFAYFAAHHAVRPMIQWVYLENLNYAQASAMGARWNAARVTVEYVVRAVGEKQLLLPYTLGLVALPVALVLRRTRLEIVTPLLLLAGVAAVSLGLQLYGHYLTFLHLGFAMAFGVALDLVLAIPPLLRRPALGVVAAAVVCAVLFAPHARVVRRDMDLDPDDDGMRRHMETDPAVQLARRIREAAAPGDRLLPIGDPMTVAFYSGLLPPGRYPYLPGFWSAYPDFVADTKRTRPKFIFVGYQVLSYLDLSQEAIWPGIRDTLAEGYDLWIDHPSGRVYRRRD